MTASLFAGWTLQNKNYPVSGINVGMVTPRGSATALWLVQGAIHSFLHPTRRVPTQENGTMTARAIQADRLGDGDRADIELKPKHLLLIA